MLTLHESLMSGEDVMEDEPTPQDEERAMLIAENSGIEFDRAVEARHSKVIELLDDDDKEIEIAEESYIDRVKRDNKIGIKIKEHDQQTEIIEESEELDTPPEDDGLRRSGRVRIANRQYGDYELYVTVAEEEEFLLTTNSGESDVPAPTEAEEDGIEAVAHYIMMHYDKQEKIKRKKKYKPKAGQYSLNAGLRRFGEKGETAVTKELGQFNNYKVFEPIHANTLNEQEKREALSSLIFLKEKRNGDVKARSCANGSVQQEHVAKDEVALPTVALQSVFIT